ncbi:MAG TPA: hypothetical protein PLM98_12275, partial [Thiolinea sp.]|nr:hypothetical protein [Thiolinea sp.]
TPSTMLGFMLSLLLLAYTAIYALQFIRLRSQWSEGLKVVNPPLAVVTAVLCLLVLSPLLDPQTWSANDQLKRLQTGKISAQQVDYDSLYRRWGRPGLNALATLQTWKDRPDYTIITKQIEQLKEDNSNTEQQAAEALTKIRVIPQDRQVDIKAFIERSQLLEIRDAQFATSECSSSVSANTDCLLVFQDVNGDAKAEALLLAFTVSAPNSANTAPEYHLDGRLYLLDEQGLPLHVKHLSNATTEGEIDANNRNYFLKQIYPALTKAAFEQAKAAAEARQLTPMLPTLPDLKIGGQLLQDQN